MRSKTNAIRVLSYLTLAVGVAVVTGCANHTASTPTGQPSSGQTLQSAGAPVQPYTVIDQLPAKPAAVQDRRRSLHLTYRDDRYYLADSDGDYYDCARDSRGNLYPAYYDREIGKYSPLYYDSDRDRYYSAVHEDGRFYRRYWDDPQDLYSDDVYDYDDYRPRDRDRPVVYVQKNYYNEYNNGSFNRPHHGHNNNALWAAIPLLAVAFVALERSGHHEHPAVVARRVPPRPAATYRAAPPQRPGNAPQRQTVVARQTPQQPFAPSGHGPIGLTRAPRPMPTMPPMRRTVAAGPPLPPSQPARFTRQRPFFAHKQQPKPNIAAKPAPRPVPVAVKPAAPPLFRAARPVARPAKVAAKPAPQMPRKQMPRNRPQVAKLPAVHTHPMIVAKPAPKPGPKMAMRPQQRPKPKMVVRPPAPSRPKVAAQTPPHPMPKQAPSRPMMKVASQPAAKPKPPSPPVYHRTQPSAPKMAAQKPAQKPASAPPNKWRAAIKNAKPQAKQGGSVNGEQKKKQKSG